MALDKIFAPAYQLGTIKTGKPGDISHRMGHSEEQIGQIVASLDFEMEGLVAVVTLLSWVRGRSPPSSGQMAGGGSLDCYGCRRGRRPAAVSGDYRLTVA